jgi:hypothetical protein
VIIGLDTHMILGTVPVLLPDTPQRLRRHQPDITPLCRDPGGNGPDGVSSSWPEGWSAVNEAAGPREGRCCCPFDCTPALIGVDKRLDRGAGRRQLPVGIHLRVLPLGMVYHCECYGVVVRSGGHR